jgi:gluconolactonase
LAYFTDPSFAHGPATTDSIFARPVYRITPESAGHKVVYEDSMPSPNGIELTRDEKTLYIASYLDNGVYRYDVAADGSLGTRRAFLGNIDDADSLCLDAAGNLYVGASAGLRIYRPDGQGSRTRDIRTCRIRHHASGAGKQARYLVLRRGSAIIGSTASRHLA